MKLKQLVGVGMLAAPAALGVAHAQAAPKPAPAAEPSEPKSYFSLSVGQIEGSDYSYDVEGIIDVEAEIGDGYIIEAAYGRRFGDNWRGEIAVSWRDHDNATTNSLLGTNLTGPGMSAYTVDAIGYYDFRPDSPVNFYVGAGLGVGSLTIDDGVIVDSTGEGLQLQAIGGMEAKLSTSTKVFAEARVRSFRPSIEAGTVGASGEVRDDFNITSASIQAGVKFLF
jgi:opacity protein-like surface antigen